MASSNIIYEQRKKQIKIRLTFKVEKYSTAYISMSFHLNVHHLCEVWMLHSSTEALHWKKQKEEVERKSDIPYFKARQLPTQKVYPTRYGLLVSQTYWIVLPKGTINIIILIICICKHKILQLILIVRHISLFCVIFTSNTTKIKENLLFCLWKQMTSVFDPYSLFYHLY